MSRLSLVRINGLLSHKPRLAALSAYGYQAIAALLLILVVSRLLPPAEYATFSLVMATSQFAGLGAFDWVRFAATRFYPGTGEGAERQEKATLAASFLAMAALGLAAVLVCLIYGLPARLTMVGAAIAAAQAGTDLQLTMSRGRGHYTLFATNQYVRATVLCIGGILGASMTGSALGAMTGVVIGYAISLVSMFLSDPALRLIELRATSVASLRDHARYGFPAAGASVVHLGTTVALRYAVSLLVTPAAVPGMLLAIDLLQRPFNLAFSALNDVIYPSVVAAHDRGEAIKEKLALRVLYCAELGAIAVLALLVFAFAGPISHYVASAPLREAFSDALPMTTILMALRITLTGVLALPFHLAKRSGALAAVAVVDFLTTSISLWVAAYWMDLHTSALLLAPTCAVLLTMAINLLLRYRSN